jgi:tetratricopeptide (TPR) repeat protein
VRFSLLETLRQYGEECLAERGDTARMRDRHLAYYLDVARKAYELQQGPRQLEAAAVFDREWDNMRAAQVWAMAIDAFDVADELLRHTVVYAMHSGSHEFIAWVERLLGTDTDGPSRSSRTYEAAAAFAVEAGDFDRAVEYCQRGIARNSAGPDVSECWATMANAYSLLGQVDKARAAIERAEAEDTTDVRVHFWNLVIRVWIDSADEWADISEAVDRVSAFGHQIGAPYMLNWSNTVRGFACLRIGDREGALVAYRAAHAGALATGAAFDETLSAAGIIWAILTDPDARPSPECSRLLHRIHDRRQWGGFWYAVEPVAYYFANAGQTEVAARTVGYLHAHAGHWLPVSRLREQTLQIVGRHSQAEEWISLGARMEREEILADMFDLLGPPAC